MWRLSSRFFLGLFGAAICANAVALYLLHDVDADRIGKLNLAYGELMEEFFIFSAIACAIFLLVTWIGKRVLRLHGVRRDARLALLLGIALIVIQYPAEFLVRHLASQRVTDAFLLAYLLFSPFLCAAIFLFASHKRQSNNATEFRQNHA